MPTHKIVEQVANLTDWNARVAVIRTIPETFGTREHAQVYSEIARRVYVPNLKGDVGYVHWRDEYELRPVQEAYDRAFQLTCGFSAVDRDSLEYTLAQQPSALQIFRLLLGLTGPEFVEACALAAQMEGLKPVSKTTVRSMEAGKPQTAEKLRACAATIDLGMKGLLFPAAPSSSLRPKLEKPDTAEGWVTVRRLAREGVPLPVFLHLRAYGGAFRQLLDATGSIRGDVLEDQVEKLFQEHGIPSIRTGFNDQLAVEREFGLTVRPAPDFVIHSAHPRSLRAILECKAASDGGTARDKASRFRALRQEGTRLGGIPVFAVLSGAGWRRTKDALGPVIQATDGRTFTPATLPDLLQVDPFPGLARHLSHGA